MHLSVPRPTRGPLGVMLAALALGMTLAVAPHSAAPANAADGELLISEDGVTWSTGLASNIFDTSGMLVPGDSLDGAFYVKNDNTFPAYLRVGLSTLHVTNWEIAQALSMTTIGTGASGASGSAAALSGAGVVCADLLQRADPVPPGGVVLVSVDLLFRQSTSGQSAQGAIAQIAFIVELSDVDLNAFAQPLCNNSATIGPAVPGVSPTPGGGTSTPAPGGGGGSGGGTGTGTGTGTGSGAGPDAGAGDPAASASPTGTSGAQGPGSVFDRPSVSTSAGTITIDGPIALDTSFFNTVRWWEEYAILILIGAALLGMLGRVYIERWLSNRRERAGQA